MLLLVWDSLQSRLSKQRPQWRVHYMSNFPILHIVTGPPGSGKTTFSKTLGPDIPVYDHDLGNKRQWIAMTPHEAILNAAAPSNRNKSYWISLAKQNGYSIKLYTMWLPRMTAFTRMKQRSGLSKTQRNDLQSGVELWYRSYSRHPQEIRVDA